MPEAMSAQSQTGPLIREQLAQATAAWVASGLDRSLLLSRERLAETEAWVAETGNGEQLSPPERDLLVVSRACADADERDANRRRRARRRWIWALALFAVAMTVFASVASRSYHSTAGARDQAASRTVALEAREMESTDPSLAAQLALVAYRLSHTTQAKSALIDVTAGPLSTRLLGPIGGPTSIALGDDGHRVAAAYSGDGEVRIYSLRYAQLTLLGTLYTDSNAGSATTTTSDGTTTAMATATTPTATTIDGINTNSTTIRSAGASLNAVAISANGQLVATGGTRDRVVLWDLTSLAHPRKLATLRAGAGAVTGLSFNPAGTQLAASDADGTVARWSLTSPAGPAAQAPLIARGRPQLRAVSYSPDGDTLTAVGNHGKLIIWPASGSHSPLATLTADPDRLTSIAYSPSGTTLAAGSGDGKVYVWTLSKAGEPAGERDPLKGFHGSVDSVAFSRGGSYVSAGGSEGWVRSWSVRSWAEVATQPGPAAVTGLAFTDGNRRELSIDVHGTIRLTQFAPSSAHRTEGPVTLLAYTQDAKRLALISGADDGSLRWWGVSDEWNPTSSTDGAISSITGSQAPGDVQAIGPGPFLKPTSSDAAVIKPGWKQLATVDSRDQIKLWALRNGKPAGLISTLKTGGAGRILGLALSPDGALLAAATSKDQIVLWQLTDLTQPLVVHPRLVAKFGHFTRYPYTVTFAPDSRELIAGGADQTVEIWNVSDLDELEPVSDETVPEPVTGPLTGPTGVVLSVAVSPDGKTLAASTSTGQVWLWNISTATRTALTATLTAATGDVSRIAFSPSDNTLAAISNDDRITFWHYRPYEAVNRVCAYAGSPITKAEWYQYVPVLSYEPPCENWTAPVLTSTTTTAAGS
jgi:WD40 repeat protein